MIWQLHGALGCPADFDGLDVGEARAVDVYAQVASYAEWASGFCKHVRGRDEDPVLMGYSMGGRLAMHALLEDPGMWKAAVIVSADFGKGRDDARIARDAEWARKARELPWEEFMREWNAQPVFAGTENAGERAKREGIAEAFEMWSVGRQENLLRRFAELELPVLWVVGERDEKFVRLGEEAIAALPKGKLEIVADAGHRVMWDQRERFVELVRSFLEESTENTE